MKGSKYLLLSNRCNLSRKDRSQLKDLMAANERLNTVYVMRDQLKHIWSYRSEAWAFKAIFSWCFMAQESGIPALDKFSKGLQKFARGILNHCRFPIHTSRIEGVNNTITVIKRIAYGFRDDDYSVLKIKGAFPGNISAPQSAMNLSLSQITSPNNQPPWTFRMLTTTLQSRSRAIRCTSGSNLSISSSSLFMKPQNETRIATSADYENMGRPYGYRWSAIPLP